MAAFFIAGRSHRPNHAVLGLDLDGGHGAQNATFAGTAKTVSCTSGVAYHPGDACVFDPAAAASRIKINSRASQGGHVKSFCTLSLTVALSMVLWAQPEGQVLPDQPLGEPLTNVQIETMVVNGIPDSTILLKIQIAVDRGMVNLDDSGTALGVLKAKGASERVLNAVVWAAPFSTVWLKRKAEAVVQQAEQKAAPGLPRAAGAYFQTSSGWARLPSFVFWTPFYSGWAWMNGDHEYSIPISSYDREVEISGSKPTFYVRQSRAGQEWDIALVTSQKNRRELQMVSPVGQGKMAAIPAKQQHLVTLTPVVGDIFTLRPTQALLRGEYVLCTGVPGGPGLDVCYKFTVQ